MASEPDTDSEPEPFFHATAYEDQPTQIQQQPLPFEFNHQMPCTFESIPAGIFAGALGFLLGAGAHDA
jgi:hypothetical protein